MMQELNQTYLTRDRGYGQGDVRIGDIVEVGDDIYSLGFICQISDELISENFDVIEGRILTDRERKKMIHTTQMLYDPEPE